MNDPQLAQLELFSEIDELIRRLKAWADPASAWEPMNHCRALVRRVLARLEVLRIRLEAPLVVATFGGTGTGKSSLVNALVGRVCTKTGRQRPTTTRPVLIAHPETELEVLGLPLEDFDVERCDSAILQDVVIVDCPDPDTTETEAAGSNLARLHRLLPHCDVLIYTSTQQKYRSARVADELGQAATGCRLIFVQTHADLDDDVRDDWISQLDGRYDVPEAFFVDSVRALEDQQSGRRPTGDLGRLQNLLTTRLGASQRLHVRRANLLDLIHATLEHCRQHIAEHRPALEELQTALQQQRDRLVATMTGQLRDELQRNQNLWERRLLESVTQLWGFSPFSSVLRVYNGLGSLIASASFFRVRTSAQLVLLGAWQGSRWISAKQQEKQAESQLGQLGTLGLDDSQLREAQVVVSGYAHAAEIEPDLAEERSLDRLRHEAVRVEDQFLGDASRRIAGIIESLAAKKSGLLTRAWYELLFLLFVGFVLYRVGRNFFYDSFLYDAKLLPIDFYISAAIFFLLWSGLLVMAFTRRLRRGLKQEINVLAQQLADSKFEEGLFPHLEETCREAERRRSRLESIAARTEELRHKLAAPAELGAPQGAIEVPVGVGKSK